MDPQSIPSQPSIPPVIPPPQPSRSLSLPLIIGLLIIIFLIGLGGYYLGIKQSAKQSIPSPTITPISITRPTQSINIPDETEGWNVYTEEKFSFRYPNNWNASQKLARGSGYEQYFNDPTGAYKLSVLVDSNYNQKTGQPFLDINDYVGFPYKLDPIIIDGVTGVKTLPHGGSETSFGIAVISKDSKWIINLQLTTPKDGSLFDKGNKIFDQILSTFEFLDKKTDDGKF